MERVSALKLTPRLRVKTHASIKLEWGIPKTRGTGNCVDIFQKNLYTGVCTTYGASPAVQPQLTRNWRVALARCLWRLVG